ncbi:MAG: hypothetical protein GY822_16920 [Deltaproteobacteria bacterium]|nr:hypothetical protein [Deltaproteobacteria bacterium]
MQDGEASDSAALGGTTCEALGFGAGTLTCNSQCQGFVIDECGAGPSCGNGVLDDSNEVCDIESFGGATCESQGFGPGDLVCRANFTGFSTENCAPPPSVCGDGVIEQEEVCEPGMLEGKTCEDFDLAGDALACNPDTCQYETAECCVPDCSEAECGADPVCGTMCDNSCSSDETCNDVNVCIDPCDGATCSGEGSCSVSDGAALCTCNSGFLPGADLTCVENPCDGQTCSGYGTCTLNGNSAFCACDEGYVTGAGLSCEAAVTDLCTGVTCNGVGDCYIDTQAGAFCVCDSGYVRDGVNITQCVVDANPPPAAWTCGGETYGNGFCDCGCGVIDEDCSGPTIAACEYQGCPDPLYPNDTQNWICE